MWKGQYISPEQKMQWALMRQKAAYGLPTDGQAFDAGSPLAGQVLDPENPMQNPMAGQVFDPMNPQMGPVQDPNDPMTGQVIDPENPMQGGGPIGPYDDPNLSIDTKSRQRQIDRQRKVADSLRGTTMGMEGRTVGPSGIYVGPNIGEIIGGAAQKIGGGLLDRSLNRAQEGVDSDVQKRTDAERGLTKALDARQQRERQEAIDLDAATRAEDLEIDEEERALQSKREEARIAEAAAAREESLRRYEAQMALSREAADRAERRASTAEMKAETAAEKLLNQNVAKYGSQLEKMGIPQAQSNMSELDVLLQDYAEKDKNGQWVLRQGVTTIPGIGGLSNAPLGIGEAITYGADALRGGDEIEGIGKSIKQSAQKVYNTEIKDMSGSAVSAHEMLRNLRSQGVDMWSSAENFLRGINTISNGYSSQKAALDASTEPDALDIYNSRMEEVAVDFSPARPETQEEFDALEVGESYIDPDDGRTYIKREERDDA